MDKRASYILLAGLCYQQQESDSLHKEAAGLDSVTKFLSKLKKAFAIHSDPRKFINAHSEKLEKQLDNIYDAIRGVPIAKWNENGINRMYDDAGKLESRLNRLAGKEKIDRAADKYKYLADQALKRYAIGGAGGLAAGGALTAGAIGGAKALDNKSMEKSAGTGAASQHGNYGNISNQWGKELTAAGASPATANNYINSRNKIMNWGLNPFDWFYMGNHVRAEQAQEQNKDLYIKRLQRQRYNEYMKRLEQNKGQR